MAKLTKRMRVIREKVDATKQYDINEAIALLKELATGTAVNLKAWTLLLIYLGNQTVRHQRSYRSAERTGDC